MGGADEEGGRKGCPGSKCVEGAAQSPFLCPSVSTRWLHSRSCHSLPLTLFSGAHVQWRTAPAHGARGGRVTNQIWRNLMSACPWEPRDTWGCH